MCSSFALKMFRHLLAGSLICLAAVTSSAQLQAAELTDLYQAQVDAGQSQSQWQQAAMAAVLVKLTGSDQVLSQPAIAAELKNSANYIRQFQQVQLLGRPLMQVQLDSAKNHRLAAATTNRDLGQSSAGFIVMADGKIAGSAKVDSWKPSIRCVRRWRLRPNNVV